MDKTVADVAAAVNCIEDGMTVMIGGFGGSGAPIELIHATIDRFRQTGSPGNLTVVNNNAGNGRVGLAAMIDAGMVRKMICSFPRSADPRAFTEKYLAGEIELEVVPQGARTRTGSPCAASSGPLPHRRMAVWRARSRRSQSRSARVTRNWSRWTNTRVAILRSRLLPGCRRRSARRAAPLPPATRPASTTGPPRC